MKAHVFLLLWLAAVVTPGLAQTGFTVSRHVDTAFTEAEFDLAMEDVNFRLQTVNDRCVDLACSASFVRSGAMGVFGTSGDGLDFIDTPEELSTVFDQDNRAKVVTAVDYCGGIYNPSIIGCGRCGADGYIVESWSSGDVYVHEYGHNVNVYNCAHATWCEWSIMDDDTDLTNDSVDDYECTGFGGSPLPQLCGSESGNVEGKQVVTCDVVVPVGGQLRLLAGSQVQVLSGLTITADGTFSGDSSGIPAFLYSAAPGTPKLRILDGGYLVVTGGGQIRFD